MHGGITPVSLHSWTNGEQSFTLVFPACLCSDHWTALDFVSRSDSSKCFCGLVEWICFRFTRAVSDGKLV